MLEMHQGQRALPTLIWPLTKMNRISVQMAEITQAQLRHVVTRKEAASLGLARYFMGRPCLLGHISERYVTNSRCIDCRRANDVEVYHKKKSNAEYQERKRLKDTRYRAMNRPKIRAAARLYKKCPKAQETIIARRETAMGILNVRMTAGIAKSLRGMKHGLSWQKMIGYTLAQLHSHIERQFTNGMSWANRSLWHIDHIIPLSSFTFTSPDDPEFKAAWALTNLRPLWATANTSKGAKRTLLL